MDAQGRVTGSERSGGGRRRIRAGVVIGVTGSRVLPSDPRLETQVREVARRISEQLPELEATETRFVVLSPLAEGADRLVAREILKLFPDAALEVVLPLAPDDYATDFADSPSVAEFRELLGSAHRVVQLTGRERPHAYLQAGRYVVDHCDALIGIWDGEPARGPGGTAEIIDYARTRGCPVYWIHVNEDVPVVCWPGNGLRFDALRQLDAYNRERVAPAAAAAARARLERDIRRAAEDAGLARTDVDGPLEHLLPPFIRADLLAIRYQRRFQRAGAWIYTLAAASVAVGTLALILGRGSRGLPETAMGIAEIVMLGGVLGLFWWGSRGGWQRKWIDYRFLAERLRTAFFMSVARVTLSDPRPPRSLSLSHSSSDWMVLAFRSILADVPPAPVGAGLPPGIAEFLKRAWLDDQIAYHERAGARNERAHSRLTWTANGLFILTLLLTLLSVMHVVPSVDQGLAFLTIVLPAVAASVGAVRSMREYERNAKRNHEMVNHLRETRLELEAAPTPAAFAAVLHDMEAVMAEENADWRVVLRFKELEPA